MIKLSQAIATLLADYGNNNLNRHELLILLSHCCNKSRAYLLSHDEICLTLSQWQQIKQWAIRRSHGEPAAYIVGEANFWQQTLMVTPDVLIPRPETELLIEQSLVLTLPQTAKVLELGTGSGAIAIALALERRGWQMTSTDVCPRALSVAQQNAKKYNISNITWINSNWWQSVPKQRYNLIISNPPYIAYDDTQVEATVADYEPEQALFANEAGLSALQTIIGQAGNYMANDGWLLLEHGWQQAEQIQQLVKAHPFCNIATHQDYNGCHRYTLAQYNQE